MSKSVEIIICPHCKGDGKQIEKTGAWDNDTLVPCEKCEGSGRLIKTVEFMPYSQSNYITQNITKL
jgi:DnaJ-class molecular chaperone